MKKILFIIGSMLILLIIIAGILYFLPNEISFKIYNVQAISQKDDKKAIDLFEKAGVSFPNWDLISTNNSLGRLYKDKKYDELSVKLKKVIEDKCDIKSKRISQYCENIFYLNGLVQYRLGENKEIDEQKKFFQEAIDNFQKALIINQDNKWAQENIDFIMNKFDQNKEKQNKEEKNNEKKEDEQNQQRAQQNNKETNDNSTKSDSQKDGANGEENNKEGNAVQSNQQQKDESGSKEQNEAQTSEENNESRLPKDVQKQLDEYRKQLDQEQGQEGFNRSKSAAQKNNLKNQDPFSQMMNDPFFRDFFGNDPIIQNSFEQKNLNDTIANPNEKDW